MDNTDLSKFDNSWYPHAPLAKRILWHLANSIFINSYFLFPVSFKVVILRFFGAKIGKGVMVKPKVNIKYPWLLEIGDFTWIGEGVTIDNFSKVTIGSNCCISQQALLIDGNHNYKRSTFDLMTFPITIQNGSWVGARSVVTAGVIIAEESVLTAGSILTKSTKAYGVYSGNPAQWKKQREIV